MAKKNQNVALTRAQQHEAFLAQIAEIKKNPELGRQLMVKAGILTKDGKVAPYYKRNQ